MTGLPAAGMATSTAVPVEAIWDNGRPAVSSVDVPSVSPQDPSVATVKADAVAVVPGPQTERPVGAPRAAARTVRSVAASESAPSFPVTVVNPRSSTEALTAAPRVGRVGVPVPTLLATIRFSVSVTLRSVAGPVTWSPPPDDPSTPVASLSVTDTFRASSDPACTAPPWNSSGSWSQPSVTRAAPSFPTSVDPVRARAPVTRMAPPPRSSNG